MIASFFRCFVRRPSAPILHLPDPAAIAPGPPDEFARREIRDWLASPVTQRALALMERQHPGRNIPSLLPKNEADKDAAVCFLNRIRGWESYRNALLHLAVVPPASGDVEETYREPVD